MSRRQDIQDACNVLSRFVRSTGSCQQWTQREHPAVWAEWQTEAERQFRLWLQARHPELWASFENRNGEPD